MAEKTKAEKVEKAKAEKAWQGCRGREGHGREGKGREGRCRLRGTALLHWATRVAGLLARYAACLGGLRGVSALTDGEGSPRVRWAAGCAEEAGGLTGAVLREGVAGGGEKAVAAIAMAEKTKAEKVEKAKAEKAWQGCRGREGHGREGKGREGRCGEDLGREG